MEEFDEPVQLELRTTREVAILMTGLGLVAPFLLKDGMVAGAQTASNLQIRLCNDRPQAMEDSLSEYGSEGILSMDQTVSPEGGVAALRDAEEKDPDEVIKGGL